MTDLRARYEDVAIRGLERTVPHDAPHYAANVEFVKQRFAEGMELVGYFASKYGDRPLRVLDLGAGAGWRGGCRGGGGGGGGGGGLCGGAGVWGGGVGRGDESRSGGAPGEHRVR